MDAKQQIPKLTGEAGQPGHSGYNLEETLNWDSKEFTKLKVFSLMFWCVHPWLKIVIEMCQMCYA
jgi:hypothetical protein